MGTPRRFARRPGAWSELALLSLLAVSLLVLAFLQHRFTLSASQADEQRLRTLLDERVRSFARDVDGPVTQVAFRFWIDPDWIARQPDPRAATLDTIAAAWQDWSQAPLAGLVSEVLLADGDPADPQLRRFDPMRRALVPAEWPGDLRSFRDFLVRQARGDAGWFDAAGPGPTAASAYGVLVAVPALVLGRASERERAALRFSPRGSVPEHVPVPLGGSTIVRLDQGFIVRRWLPALVDRYFPADEYDVVVRAGGKGAPLLFARGSAGAEAVLEGADARTQLLKLEIGEFGGIDEPDEPPSARAKRRHLPAPSFSEGHPRPLRAILQRSALEDPERVTLLVRTLAERGWQLRVQHRAGSLAAAAAAIRRRNLLLSYGVLLLIAASLGLVLSSARTARRLARQQVEFVAGVSHELRTPIAVMRALSANLADGIVRSDEPVATYGRHLLQHSRRLGDLVERTLEYAGIASGRRRYEEKDVDVADVVRQAASACDPLESGSRVELCLEPRLPPLRGDAAALASAVRNLIENALRYSPDETPVTVEVRRQGEQLSIAVVDHGSGVAAEDLPHLFEPFFRGRNALRDGTRGVGIGLSLTKEIAEAHGGRVEVRSEPGAGSRFCLILPVGGPA